MKKWHLVGLMTMAITFAFVMVMVMVSKPWAQTNTTPIMIGVDVPLSGLSSDVGEQMSRGVRLAVDQINKSGGINGRKVELDIQDDASDPTTGVALLDRFSEEGVVAAIGYYNSPVALATQKLAESMKIPLMVQGINSEINNPWTYHSVATDSEQARGATIFLKQREISKFAVMTDTTAFGSSAQKQVKIALKQAGLTPVDYETFEVNAFDLTPQLLRIKDGGAKAIILFSVGPPMARAMQGLQQIGYRIPVIGNFTAGDPAVSRIGGTAVNGLYFQSMVDPAKPAVEKLDELWKKAYPGQGNIGVFAVVAYDQTSIVLDGIKAGATTGPKMKQFLDHFSSKNCVSGIPGSTWKYTETNHDGLSAEELVWIEYQQGVPHAVHIEAE